MSGVAERGEEVRGGGEGDCKCGEEVPSAAPPLLVVAVRSDVLFLSYHFFTLKIVLPALIMYTPAAMWLRSIVAEGAALSTLWPQMS